jgi:hypothetical protein
LSFAVDRLDGRSRARSTASRPTVRAAALLSHGLDRLIMQARTAPLAEPQPATGLLALGDEIVMAGVSAVTPDLGSNGRLRYRLLELGLSAEVPV